MLKKHNVVTLRVVVYKLILEILLITNFGDKVTKDIFEVRKTKASRKVLPTALHQIAKRKLNFIAVAVHLDDLRRPPGNKLEALKGNLKGFHSIRINDQWRVICKWNKGNACEVTITNYH